MEKKEDFESHSYQYKEDNEGDKKYLPALEQEESRRNLKWILFARSRISFGFHHLGPSQLPNMSGERRGISICFEKVCGWSIPQNVLKMLGSGDCELTAQLSLSMFHLPSNTYFGTTWMGPTVSLGSNHRKIPDIVDFDYSDIVYMITRLADPACIAVIEIVVSKIDTRRNFVLAQFGCGWTMLNLFAKPYPVDAVDEKDKNKLLSCSIFCGSPRDLIVNSDISKLSGRLREQPNCSLFFRVYSHRKLLKVQHLISENEAIGRFDQIAGLITRELVPPRATRPQWMSCLGHDESIDDNSNILIYPSSPRLALELLVKIANCQLLVPRRDILESKLIGSFSKNNIHLNISNVRILNRFLKIGIHNGHTLVGNSWVVQSLLEDKEDKDIFDSRTCSVGQGLRT